MRSSWAGSRFFEDRHIGLHCGHRDGFRLRGRCKKLPRAVAEGQRHQRNGEGQVVMRAHLLAANLDLQPLHP